MKKSLRICSFVFLILIVWSKGYADEHFPFLGQVIKKSVNIRAGANTNFEKLTQLNEGDEIVVLGKSFDWYKVQLPVNAISYIRADYLKILQNSSAEVIGDKVNIRASANSNSASLGLVEKGTVVKVITQNNGWWQIEPPSQAAGWIRQDFLSLKSNSVKPSLSAPIKLEDRLQVKSQEIQSATIEVKGKLQALSVPKADQRFELIVEGKSVYYIASLVDVSRFNGAIVVIKGTAKNNFNQNDLPILQLTNISLLL